MEKEFVNYELALRMKQLGFDERCIMHWWKGKLSYYQMGDFSPTHTSAPTFSQAFRWFDYSTEWGGFIVPSREEGCFDWWIQNYTDPQLSIESDEWYRGREEAELACLKKLIEIVEQK